MPDSDAMQGGDRRPVPDPTLLTTAALIRETEQLKEFLLSEIIHSRQIADERFGSIQTQFRERDVRSDQSSRDGKLAVDAALQAAKEAVAKSEDATGKQLGEIKTLISTGSGAMDEKINDVKDRLTRMEGTGVGRQDSGKTIFAVIGAVIGLLGIALAAVMAIRKG